MKLHTFNSRWRQLKELMQLLLVVLRQRKISAMKICALLSFLYQFVVHRRWWSGVLDTFSVVVRHLRPCHYRREVFEASDGEQYCVWSPKGQPRTITEQKTHLWLCLPGGMESFDPCFAGMVSEGAFAGSRVCIFNNPGISTRMRHKVLPSPTETRYVIECIRALQRKHSASALQISLIGFSIGSVQALRTVHTLCNDRERFGDIHIRSVVLVHAPDIVREAIQHFQVFLFFFFVAVI